MNEIEERYRRIAEASSAGKRMRDIVPNNPDEFRTRIYGARLRNQRDGLPRQDGDPSINAVSTNQMYVSLGRQKVSCPECNAEPGEPCHSIDKRQKGAVMKNSIHGKRLSMAKRMFARKG